MMVIKVAPCLGHQPSRIPNGSSSNSVASSQSSSELTSLCNTWRNLSLTSPFLCFWKFLLVFLVFSLFLLWHFTLLHYHKYFYFSVIPRANFCFTPDYFSYLHTLPPPKYVIVIRLKCTTKRSFIFHYKFILYSNPVFSLIKKDKNFAN